MNVLNVAEARAQFHRLIDDVASAHEPILITGKRNNAVLISEEDWDAIHETLHLLSIPGMGESIQSGLKTDISACSEKSDWANADK